MHIMLVFGNGILAYTWPRAKPMARTGTFILRNAIVRISICVKQSEWMLNAGPVKKDGKEEESGRVNRKYIYVGEAVRDSAVGQMQHQVVVLGRKDFTSFPKRCFANGRYEASKNAVPPFGLFA